MTVPTKVAATGASVVGASTADAAEAPAPSLPHRDRRREARYQTNDPADVEVLRGGAGQLQGTIVDVSQAGLRLHLSEAIGRGIDLKIRLTGQLVIFGQVRYCRRVDSGFQVGVAIEDVFFAHSASDEHLHDDDLGLYLLGKGLTVLEVLRLKDHLLRCTYCARRLDETHWLLHPFSRRKERLAVRASSAASHPDSP